jgi:hypothetical protein
MSEEQPISGVTRLLSHGALADGHETAAVFASLRDSLEVAAAKAEALGQRLEAAAGEPTLGSAEAFGMALAFRRCLAARRRRRCLSAGRSRVTESSCGRQGGRLWRAYLGRGRSCPAVSLVLCSLRSCLGRSTGEGLVTVS